MTATIQDDGLLRRDRHRAHMDPRTKLLLVLAAGVVVMAPGGARFLLAFLCIGVLLAVSEAAWRRVIAVPVAAGALAALAYVLPAIVRHPAVGILGTLAVYLLRMLAVGAVAAHLIRTTGPSEFTAALRAARVPRAITVSAAVMLRFVPTIVAEARAVRDAMRLRGLGDASDLIRHPILSIEYFTVPLIASSLRVADDLTAAALLRGLGSRTPPTSMHPPRFTTADAMAAITAAALIAATLLWGGHR
ncbi:energy-coupling factor transporter transmembrane component T [Nocardia sp. NPDC058519]|uniref:energy-coupling factor transporter transmembrane component T n=1 Tax=Nocardia sp. NPDC058519 TaxID=3346535 RepID=UPI003666ECAE